MKRVLIEYDETDSLLDKRVERVINITGVIKLEFSAMEKQIEYLHGVVAGKEEQINHWRNRYMDTMTQITNIIKEH